MPAPPVLVLDVGQCSPDHAAISRMLTANFDVRVERAADVGEALAAMGERGFALVLVNRLIDQDGSDGMELIRGAAADEHLRKTPVMLVSDYADAQAEAVRLGATRGFGKSQIEGRETLARLAQFLPEKRPGR